MWPFSLARRRRCVRAGAVRTIAFRLGLAALCAVALAHSAPAGPINGTPPYPPSPYITQMTLDWSTYRRDGIGSDNWVTTWAADGNLYTSFGDGGGFGPGAAEQAYVSLGFAKLTGNSAATVQGVNLVGGLNPIWGKCFPYFTGDLIERLNAPGRIYPCYGQSVRAKSRSLLALGDQLYAHLTPGSEEKGYAEARLYATTIGTNAWRRASWAFTPTGAYPIIAPAFVQAGKNGADAPDGYVYVYAVRYGPTATVGYSLQSGPNGGEITLMRAASGADLLKQTSWFFFAGLDRNGQPIWMSQQAKAKGVFFDRNKVGWTMSAIYVKALDRYLLLTANTLPRAGRLGVFEAKKPWGPWRTVFYSTVANSAKDVPANAPFFSYLANSFSGDGSHFSLAFYGRKPIDAINLIDGSFTLVPAAR